MGSIHSPWYPLLRTCLVLASVSWTLVELRAQRASGAGLRKINSGGVVKAKLGGRFLVLRQGFTPVSKRVPGDDVTGSAVAAMEVFYVFKRSSGRELQKWREQLCAPSIWQLFRPCLEDHQSLRGRGGSFCRFSTRSSLFEGVNGSLWETLACTSVTGSRSSSS